jgi:small subunit ribosomal protein S1
MTDIKDKSADSSSIKIEDQDEMSKLLENDINLTKTWEIGEMVTGKVMSIGKGRILVDIFNIATGLITGKELQDSTNTIASLSIGDEVSAIVIHEENDEGYIGLSLQQASQGKTWEKFVKAFKNNDNIDVIVKEANKGGLLIEKDGIRGFIPVSQLAPEHYPRVPGGNSTRILMKLQELIGKTLSCRVINIDENEGRLILSEKEAQKEDRMKVIGDIKEGQIVEGVISGVVDFGIFVNYRGVEGLVHISEIDWGHVANPADYAHVGKQVKVLVLGVEGEKISFSIKQLTSDPWLEVVQKYKVGDKIKGIVNKITNYGVFVKIEAEITGLIHISEVDENNEEPDLNSMFQVGQEVEAKIAAIREDDHELALTILKEPRGKVAEKEAEA